TVQRTVAAGKIVFVNMDSTPGLGHDPGALTYLKGIGAIGICSTRAAIIERANGLGLLAMQKVFVTDRSNLRRSLQSVARSQPDLVQLMPAIVLRYMERQARDLGVPYLAAGFVQGAQDVAEALHHGAAGVCTSDEGLWELRRSALRVS
ncbi:glycerol-3-phosphate responsive antiterminator, partial [Streptosporangium sandarakinum]